MIDVLVKLFGPKATPSAQELREALPGLASERALAAERHQVLVAGRRQVLLTGSPADISTHDAKIAATGAAVEQIDARISAARERLAEIEHADGAALEQAEVDRAEKAAAVAAALVPEYRRLAEKIAGVVERMSDADDLVFAVNRKITKHAGIGFAFLVDVPPVRTTLERAAEGPMHAVFGPRPLWASVNLPDPTDPSGNRTIWPMTEGSA